MSRKTRKRHKTPSFNGSASNPLFYYIVSGLILIGFIAIFALGAKEKEKKLSYDKVTMCPKAGPHSTIAILIDRTDTIQDVARLAIEKEINHWAAKVPLNGAFKVYEVGQGGALHDPIINLCNPGKGSSSKLGIIDNPGLDRLVYERKFLKPVHELIEGMKNDRTADQSLILEAIQAITTRDTGVDGAEIPTTLVIISDFLQFNPNDSDMNFYKGAPHIAQFMDLPSAKFLRANMGGTNHNAGFDIELRLIYRPSLDNVQTGQLITFWESWFREQGAHRVNYKPLTGLKK